MFNCSQLFNNSSIYVIDKCLNYCDRLMSECLCECLKDYKQEDKSYLSTQVVFTIGIAVALVATGICLFGMKCRQRTNINITPIRNDNTNNINNNTNPELSPDINIEINYYDLPKYEDIKDHTIIIPINTDIPPKYEEV